MRKLDPQRPYGRISPPHQGAHFDQDGLLFDVHGDCLSDASPPAAAVDSTPAPEPAFEITEPESGSQSLPHAAEPQESPRTSGLSDHQRLRNVLKKATGRGPRSVEDCFKAVEQVTGVRPDTRQDALDLLQAEGFNVEAENG